MGRKMATTNETNVVSSDWYREGRRAVDAYFVPENLVAASEETHLSPSRRYRLVVQDFKTKPGAGDFSRGLVSAGDRQIAEVRRNYGIFHFGWAESHANGHDYLLCGEDYQGQTVIELDTGKRVDYIPQSAEKGIAFCCAAYYPAPDSRLVVVDGCYWARPYELVVSRFDDPMTLPWPQVERIDFTGEVVGWSDEGFIYTTCDDIRITDGKPADEMTAEQWKAVWEKREVLAGVRKRRWLRLASGEKRILEEQVKPRGPVLAASKLEGKWRQCSSCSDAWQEDDGVRFAVCPNCGRLTEMQLGIS
jgi:hypothetical protein